MKIDVVADVTVALEDVDADDNDVVAVVVVVVAVVVVRRFVAPDVDCHHSCFAANDFLVNPSVTKLTVKLWVPCLVEFGLIHRHTKASLSVYY